MRITPPSQLDGLRRATSPARQAGNVVLVASGKGGIGTSTVAALLATTLAANDRSVLLVDADDQLGTLHLMLDVERAHTLGDLRGGIAPEKLLVHARPGLMLLAGGASNNNLSAIERKALWRRITPLFPSFDLVLVDGGSRADALSAAATCVPDRLLALTSFNRVALASTFAMLKLLHDHLPADAVEVLAIREDEHGGRAAFDHLHDGAQRFLSREVVYAGAVPEDSSIERALALDPAALLPEIARAPAVAALSHLGERLLADLTRARSGVARSSTDGSYHGTRQALASARPR